ncbi:TetR/AcrR family transcriptional regulator [Actinomadura sp. 7K507]|uniref:TetR/AcrR family transcriptional regulator n=1 Tax=Actinomadura sp. 7K507 TaxID=2530365 RepID=UPI001404ACD5|nr:TetR/AcrR family transcriptional regulator [Actinomadura sp. 7K507]
MNSSRPYTMGVRAERAERTRRAILAAAVTQLKGRLRSDIRLDDIAAQAGVTVQTVLRVFGSKARLFQVALDEVITEMRLTFEQAEPGDVVAAVRTWFDHYEEFGDVVIANLADEHDRAVAPVVRIGRERHRERVETVLAPQLARFTGARRDQVIDALVCACDVYTWKLLRRDMRRPREEAEVIMRMMISSILEVE